MKNANTHHRVLLSFLVCSVVAAVMAIVGAPRAPVALADSAPSVGSKKAATKPSDDFVQLAKEVYIYAYPLVLMDVTREVMAAKWPVNQFEHLRAFPNASFTDVVSPNADTLYSSAWLDLSKEPVVLSLPATGKRYYLMPMLDGWSNVFASPGTRTTGNGRGNYVVVGPNWKGEVPKGLKVIQSPTSIVWIIGRTQTNGKSDYAAVNALQDKYTLTALSRWGKSQSQASAPASSVSTQVAQVAQVAVDTKTPPVEQVARMNAQTFFARFANLLAANPPLAADGAMVEKMKSMSIAAGQPFDINKLGAPGAPGGAHGARANSVAAGVQAARDALAQAAKPSGKPGNLKNGWDIRLQLGEYGTRYSERAFIALIGLGANLPTDAVYPMTRVDSEGASLTGKNAYVLHFEKKQVPPVHAFWSLTMYNDKQFFVSNPIERYAIGDRDKLKFNKDGSLDIYVQHASPSKDKVSNWLPAPEGSFNLIMRLYYPKQEVLDGTWTPPAPKKVSAN